MKIAVVDDSPRDLQLIKGYVERYFKENGGDYQVRTFENGLDFWMRRSSPSILSLWMWRCPI